MIVISFIYSFSSKTFIKWLLCENESNLIICGFCICKLVCSLKFICNFRINTHSGFMLFVGMCIHRAVDNMSSGNICTRIPSWGRTMPYTTLFFQFSYCKQNSFLWYICVTFCSFLCFLLLTLLLKWLPSVVCKCCLGCDVPFYGENACIR